MRRKILYLTIAYIAFHILLLIGHFVLRPTAIDRCIVLNDGWDVQYNNTEYKNISLSALRRLIGTGTFREDRIILSHENVDLTRIISPTLLFETRFSAWKVSADNEVVTERYYEKYENSEYIGCDNNFVTLPSIEGSVNIAIELLVSEDGAYSYFEPPVIGAYKDIMLFAIYNYLFIFMTSAFLIVFGVIFFAIAVGFRINLPEIKMQMYSALLYIVLGIWFLTQFKILGLFFELKGHQTEIEYISLYLIVPLMYLVMGSMQDYLKNKVFLVFSTTGSIVAVLPIVLHFAGIVHLNQMLLIYQADSAVLLVFMIVMVIKDSREKRVSHSQIIQLVGQIVLSLSFLFNVFFYYLELMGVSEQIMLSKKAVPMGTLCMVFATLVNYQIFLTESVARKKEQASLVHLAYEDGLTGIPNRSRYEKYLTDLSSFDEDFCVISIDLNGLKGVNDNQSHLEGDKYLNEFGKVLENCFFEKGFYARIGGDEFVAVLRGENMELADRIIKEMDEELEKLNRKDPSIKRSAATGYAFRHEITGSDWNEVYLLADERMYMRKVEMKKQR
ncbi:GGDEF domain-containing protein [Butyrivibrio sp. AE3004]|uniref:GGDEF domain-containing protein n=1 Tax=Butyrivibrio sp. AE3004 TaxID=1506994 RepID=UPI000494C269|nr:GGDEF domain-containing protein [Butyrivibrio sp. AE3004]